MRSYQPVIFPRSDSIVSTSDFSKIRFNRVFPHYFDEFNFDELTI